MGVTVPSGWFQVTSGLSLRQDEFDERKHVSSGGPTNRCDCGKFRGRLRSQVGMEWHLRVGRVCDCFLRTLWYRHAFQDRPNCVCCGDRCFAAMLVLHRRIDQFLCIPTEIATARDRANHSIHRQEGDDLHNRHGAVSCELAHPGGNWYEPHLACRGVGRWSFKLHRTASSLAKKQCLP
jgi:hypothetical protein